MVSVYQSLANLLPDTAQPLIAQNCSSSEDSLGLPHALPGVMRFPRDFMFQLTSEEKADVVADCDHLSGLEFSKSRPYAFTEHGAIMAASVPNTLAEEPTYRFLQGVISGMFHTLFQTAP